MKLEGVPGPELRAGSLSLLVLGQRRSLLTFFPGILVCVRGGCERQGDIFEGAVEGFFLHV